MMIRLTDATKRFVAMGTAKYVLVFANGEIIGHDKWGKAVGFAFMQKGAALHRARLQSQVRPVEELVYVWDVKAERALRPAETWR